MTPAEAKACADFLGPQYTHVHVYEGEDLVCKFNSVVGALAQDDPELFYALLLRAQSLGLAPDVEAVDYTTEWRARMFAHPKQLRVLPDGVGETPLAALAALVKLYAERPI